MTKKTNLLEKKKMPAIFKFCDLFSLNHYYLALLRKLYHIN